MDTKKLRWLVGGIILAVLGCGLSVYLTLHHMEVKRNGFTDAFCNVNDTFSCDDIAKSEYAEVFGIPLGVYGFGYFLALLILSVMTIYKGDENYPEGPVTYKLMVAVGVVSSIVLGLVSWFGVGKFCISCMIVYGVTFLQAIWMVIHSSVVPKDHDVKVIANGAITATIAVLLSVTVFNFTLGAGEVPGSKPAEMAKLTHEFNIDYTAYSGLGEDYRKGNDDAKVTIVEFADFECPACGEVSKTLQKVYEEYKDRVLVVFKNYPIDNSCNPNVSRRFHENACHAAILARCAGTIDKFWDFHDRIFARQRLISKPMLLNEAKAVGLSQGQIDQCLASKDIVAKIQEDIEEAEKAQVTGTPSIFINGRQLQGGRSIDDLRRQIDFLLNRL